MCGIAGLIGFKGDLKGNIGKMNDRMLHRGPDDEGIYISENGKVALGHRRLSIVDLSKKGAQPMMSHSGRKVIAYNGEIYNASVVKDKLIAEGKVTEFNGTSDTEILIEAIDAYGMEETLTMCKGMFGIAVYDIDKNTVTFARDRVGEKPLYYGTVGGAFAFASDIGCLRVIDGFDNEINREVLDIYFTEGYIPAPYTIYKGIYKLEAGSIMTVNVDDLSSETKSYFSMTETAVKGQSNLFKGSKEEAAEELERLLKESIKGQMVADVPLGAFLSAGIDSSTIVALMQSVAPGKVRTFTVGMEDKKFNEAEQAGEIARHLGTIHTEEYITEKDAKEVIPQLSFMFGEPFADSSQIPTYLVSKMTRKHVTVSLSGDGGDELFAGYRSYESVERVWGKVGKLPYFIRKPASVLMLNSPYSKSEAGMAKSMYMGAKGPGDVHRLEHEGDPIVKKIVLKNGAKSLSYKYTEMDTNLLADPCHNAMLMDMLVYHPDDILVKVDRTAMAVSLETRVPMLDRDILEFAWSLPRNYLREGNVGKQVLRNVLYKYVPKEMVNRPKKGFSIPIDKWLLDDKIRQWAEALLDKNKIRQQGILDPDVVEKIWTDFTQRGIYRIQIWYILMFQQWYEKEYMIK